MRTIHSGQVEVRYGVWVNRNDVERYVQLFRDYRNAIRNNREDFIDNSLEKIENHLNRILGTLKCRIRNHLKRQNKMAEIEDYIVEYLLRRHKIRFIRSVHGPIEY